MGGWNYKANAVRTSWVTGIETTPADDVKCVRCKKANATCWCSYLYESGKKRRVVEGFRPTCADCSEAYAVEQNAKAEKKADKKKASKPAKGRKASKAKTPKTQPAVEITEQERELTAKYPDAHIKPSSWLPSGGRSETHGKKVTVITVCLCGAETVRASSDLWQCGRLCPQCRKDAAKNKTDKKKQEKQ